MKNRLKLVLTICALLCLTYYFSQGFKNTVLALSSGLINGINATFTASKNAINEYFNQAKTIEILRAENEKNQYYKNLYEAQKIEFDELLKLFNATKSSPHFATARVASYEKIDNALRFWLSTKAKITSPKGLIFGDKAIGIVLLQNKQPLAISLKDSKCAFSVFIGKDKIPAIVMGDERQVKVQFLQEFIKISEGDEVITSGKDSLFPAGIKVGKIAKIIDNPPQKTAILQDFEELKNHSYIQIITQK